MRSATRLRAVSVVGWTSSLVGLREDPSGAVQAILLTVSTLVNSDEMLALLERHGEPGPELEWLIRYARSGRRR